MLTTIDSKHFNLIKLEILESDCVQSESQIEMDFDFFLDYET